MQRSAIDLRRLLLCVLVLLAAAPAAAAAPRVVASILPIQSLAAGVMGDLGAPGLIVRGGASPHSYALRPSDAAELAHADIVLWVGPEYESFLAKPIRALGGKARAVALFNAEGIEALPARKGGSWEIEKQPRTRRKVQPPSVDPHIFLDPANAMAMVRRIAQVIGEADPEHRDRYRTNAERLIARLKSLDLELEARLAPVRGVPFVVFHDGYQYLEHRYGLAAVGSLVVSPDRPPAARRLVDIRTKIASLHAACVFAEPQFRSSLVGTVTSGTQARTGALDSIGVDLTPGPDAYFAMMRRLADSLVACLSR